MSPRQRTPNAPRSDRPHRPVLAAVFAVVLACAMLFFWVVEAGIESYVFERQSFGDSLLAPDPYALVGAAVGRGGTVCAGAVIPGTPSVLPLQASDRQIAAWRDQAQQVLNVAPVMFVALDDAGNVTMMNRKGLELLGARSEAIIGQHWSGRFVAPADRDATDELLNETFQVGTVPAEVIAKPHRDLRRAGAAHAMAQQRADR